MLSAQRAVAPSAQAELSEPVDLTRRLGPKRTLLPHLQVHCQMYLLSSHCDLLLKVGYGALLSYSSRTFGPKEAHSQLSSYSSEACRLSYCACAQALKMYLCSCSQRQLLLSLTWGLMMSEFQNSPPDLQGISVAKNICGKVHSNAATGG